MRAGDHPAAGVDEEQREAIGVVGHDRLAGNVGRQRIRREDALSPFRPLTMEGRDIRPVLLYGHQRAVEVEAHLRCELPPPLDDSLRISSPRESHRAEGHGAEAMPCRKGSDADDSSELHGRDGSASLFAAQELVDLVLDLLEVHERAVDGGKADVGHLVEAAELIHHQLADFTRGNVDLAPGS